MSDIWRLIVDGPVDGALNMALDRAAQLAREEGSAPPTLRLYRWTRPTVTLGRFQAADTLDASVCRAAGVDVVRRFTGGKGVLHDDEVTYAVIASVEDGVPRGVAASYRHLCAFLARTYHALGVDACLTEHTRGSSASSACYLAITRADLAYGARKLSGSAQVWAGSTVMQHGSFTISRDTAREAGVFGLSAEEEARLSAEAVTLADALDPVPGSDRIVEAAIGAFKDEFGVELRPGSWSAREAQLAATLSETVAVDLPSICPST